mgnify:CR=1 FL=1
MIRLRTNNNCCIRITTLFVAVVLGSTLQQSYQYYTNDGYLIFSDDFDTFDFDLWKHEITLNGSGNWKFQMYVNDRSNSFVKDGVLHLKPTLTADVLGEDTGMYVNECTCASVCVYMHVCVYE